MLRISENPKYLGEVRSGDTKTFTVKVYNTSDKQIDVQITRFSCAVCTTGSLKDTKIPAKGSTDLVVSFRPKATGINTKTITLNDELVFSFNAKVV
jgi:hypothetical protein